MPGIAHSPSSDLAPVREGLVVNAGTGTSVVCAQASSLHEKRGSSRTDDKGRFRLP